MPLDLELIASMHPGQASKQSILTSRQNLANVDFYSHASLINVCLLCFLYSNKSFDNVQSLTRNRYVGRNISSDMETCMIQPPEELFIKTIIFKRPVSDIGFSVMGGMSVTHKCRPEHRTPYL